MSDVSMRITVKGLESTLSMGEVRGRVIELTRAAVAVDRDRLHRFVEWGALLIQVRPNVPSGTFAQWLKDGGCTHKQIAYSAINMAIELADAHGHFSQGKWETAVNRYNDRAPDQGYKPVDVSRMSVNAARIVTSQRPGEPTTEVRARGLSGRDEPNKESVAPDAAGWDPMAAASEFAQARPAAPHVPKYDRKQPHPKRDDSASAELSSAADGAFTLATGSAPAATKAVAAGAGSTLLANRPKPKARGGDVIGQIPMEQEYAEAADLADAFARRLRDGSVSLEVMRRFVEMAKAA